MMLMHAVKKKHFDAAIKRREILFNHVPEKLFIFSHFCKTSYFLVVVVALNIGTCNY